MADQNPDVMREGIARALAAEFRGLNAAIGRLEAEHKDVTALKRLLKKIYAALMEAQRNN